MRITEAAQRLGTSPRMLRYRESLGLLPVIRGARQRLTPSRSRPSAGSGPASAPGIAAGPGPGRAPRGAGHRRFTAADLDAVALGLAIEQRYDISPAALSFGVRVLADPTARAQVTELGRRIGRIRPLPAMAMDFEKERALRVIASPAASPVRPRGEQSR